MPNLIREQRLVDNNRRALLKYVIVSDGSQQANTILVDASSLSGSLNTNGYIMSSNTDPLAAYSTTVKRVFGSVQSANAKIRIQWHGTANSEIVTCGNGNFDYNFDSMGDGASIPNPETGTNGDILISTTGLAANDTVTLFIDLRKSGRSYDQGQTADPAAFNRGNWGLR